MSICKRIVPALATGFMAIALTACGGGGSSSDSAGGGTTTPPVVVPIAPTISAPPDNQSVVAGKTATFSVQASGSGTLSYQWKKNGTDIPANATSSSYTTPATSIADNGAKYSVSVSNSVGTVTSNNATLTVTAAVVVPVVVAPTIDTQPGAQTVTEGESATFSVTASGTAPLIYQWKKNSTVIEGVTTSSHTTDATVIADSGAVFTVVVTNSAGSVASSGAALTVNPVVAPAITTQPTTQTITAGQTATFSVTAAGTAPLGYQWKKGGTDISGATSSTYTTPAMSIAGSGVGYSVVVSNSAGTVTSSSATLTVNKSSTTGYSEVANPSGGNFATTECVKESSTGLIWEGKTASGARAGTNTYTNYDASYTGGTDTTVSTNSIGYVNSVNAGSGLCGYTDWRMPSLTELTGILDTKQASFPKIDITWFPNTQSSAYWTSTAYNVNQANLVGFFTGVGAALTRNDLYPVRLVRGNQ